MRFKARWRIAKRSFKKAKRMVKKARQRLRYVTNRNKYFMRGHGPAWKSKHFLGRTQAKELEAQATAQRL